MSDLILDGTSSSLRARLRRRAAQLTVVALVAALFQLAWTAPAHASSGSSCGATINPVACENSKPGNPENEWQIDDAGDATLQGFSTDTSVNIGGTIGFKIKASTAYKIDFYRLGYYQGNGARKQNTTSITVNNPASQPTCLSDASTQNYDCGNWSQSASWTVPSTSVSGVYLAVLTRLDNGGQSHIPFVVRDDSSHSDVIYQTSDTTWQAYNLYGGSDFYQGNQQLTETQARAFKISFNRPYITRGTASGRDFLFSNEYPMIRFMEQNGYDVSYQSGVDTDRYGPLLKNHKVFLSIGHDEYWSLPQRLNV
ncbi:MAG TPA: N,N-dimethylformamidase beta subunit family domain-containing protein, partial [Jatrophihabitans sp.]|nr:N,N-dimethylformamidase beta subunit family domain-containing protein [Jatrophihabitans sp.]